MLVFEATFGLKSGVIRNIRLIQVNNSHYHCKKSSKCSEPIDKIKKVWYNNISICIISCFNIGNTEA